MWDSSVPKPSRIGAPEERRAGRSPDVQPAPAARGRPRLRIALADADALARQRMRRLIGAEPDLELAAECATGAEAARLVAAGGMHALIVDWALPGLARDLLPRLKEATADGGAPLLVALGSASDALPAIDAGAVDFLLRPAQSERVALAFLRLRERHRLLTLARRQLLEPAEGDIDRGDEDPGAELASTGDAAQVRGDPFMRRFVVKHDGRMYFVRPEDVDWIEAFGNYLRLHQGRQTHVIRMTMTSVERRLHPDRFARIHRSVIVNLDRIREMQPWFSGDYLVYLVDGTQLKLSRVYRDRLEERLRI